MLIYPEFSSTGIVITFLEKIKNLYFVDKTMIHRHIEFGLKYSLKLTLSYFHMAEKMIEFTFIIFF